MKDKKTVFLVIIFIILLGISIYVLNNKKKSNEDIILVIDNSSFWKYSDNIWSNVKGKSNLTSYNWKKFKIFSNKEYVGEDYLVYDDKWYAFNDNKEAVKLDGDLFAYSSNKEIDYYNYPVSDITDTSSVDSVLEDLGLVNDNNFSKYFKIDFDIDNDSIDEEFYVISNAFLENVSGKVFSIVYMVKDNTIYYIFKKIVSEGPFNGCKPYINSFLDVDGKGNRELIVSCANYSDGKRYDMLYSFDDLKYKILVAN